jgi:ElaB/YqjD/DUF883 family membrane-anchored ribosome-binding protein
LPVRASITSPWSKALSTIDPANPVLPVDASDWGDDWDSSAAQPAAARPSTRRGGIGLHSLADLARPRLTGLIEDARDSLVAQVRGLKSLADGITGPLTQTLGDNAEPVTRFIGQATGTIDSIADAIAEKSVEELVDDGRELVRAQPVVAVGLAIAVGFLVGRIAKASQDT